MFPVSAPLLIASVESEMCMLEVGPSLEALGFVSDGVALSSQSANDSSDNASFHSMISDDSGFSVASDAMAQSASSAALP